MSFAKDGASLSGLLRSRLSGAAEAPRGSGSDPGAGAVASDAPREGCALEILGLGGGRRVSPWRPWVRVSPWRLEVVHLGPGRKGSPNRWK